MSLQPVPDLSDVFAYVDVHRQEFLDRLIAYLRMPSISAHGQGIAEVAQYIADVMNRIGLAARIIPAAGWPMVLAERNDVPGAPTVILYGHYDVQPPDPLDEWISPPFEPTIRDGRLYARGVGDNKGQHFAQILALESLLACRGALPCNVKVLLEGEEEIGSPQMPVFARAHRDELKADLVITSDGPVDADGRSRLRFGVRGVLSFELRAHGANRDLHSGNWGGVVPNPIWTLVHLLATMKNDQGIVTIDGFYDNVDTPTPLEQETLDGLPIDSVAVKQSLDLAEFDQPVERGFYERLSTWPTFTINGLHGGYGGPGSKTVLPHEAFAKCDVRLVESQTADEIYAKVEAHIRRHAPGVEMIRQGSMDPSKTRLDSPYADPIRRHRVKNRYSFRQWAAACPIMSLPRRSAFPPSVFPTPTPTNRTTPQTRTWRSNASTRASRPVRQCSPISGRIASRNSNLINCQDARKVKRKIP